MSEFISKIAKIFFTPLLTNLFIFRRNPDEATTTSSRTEAENVVSKWIFLQSHRGDVGQNPLEMRLK